MKKKKDMPKCKKNIRGKHKFVKEVDASVPFGIITWETGEYVCYYCGIYK